MGQPKEHGQPAQAWHSVEEAQTVFFDEGMPPQDARYAALRQLGGVEQIKEECRDMRRVNYIEGFLQDVRYGLRLLRKSPGFTAVAVLTLSLGIGANTAIFGVIDAVMLRDLPVRSPQALVQLSTVGPYGVSSFSYPGYRRFRDGNDVCSEMVAIGWLNNLDSSVDGQAEALDGRIVSGNFFPFLGVNAAVGRTFTSEDDKTPQNSAVAVISYGYWKRRFGLESSVVGKSITLNRTLFTIVGVTPPGFSGPEVGYSPDIYVPMVMEPAFHDEQSWLDQPDYHWLRIMGRLKPGVDQEEARADLDVIHRQILTEIPMKGASPAERRDLFSQRLDVTSASSGIVFGLPKGLSSTLSILMTMVGLVLLIACINVANLLLGRAAVRRKEIAVRLAIGAGRFRLIRQLLTESAMLAVAASTLGLLCAYWGSDTIVALMSVGRRPLVLDVRPDPRILGFTGAISLLATILFGLVPALRSTRVDLTPALKDSADRASSKRSRLGMGQVLVVSQVALSLLLLFGGGLFVRTLENLENIDPGFDRKNVLLFDVDPTKSEHKGVATTGFYKQILERIEAIPGVHSASASVMEPITGGGGIDDSVWVEGYTSRPEENITVYVNRVAPKYFETLRTPLLLGRDFSPRDTEDSPKVAIINQTMARYFFGNSNPIGRKFGWWGVDKNKQQFEIVGVVRDSKYETLRERIPRTAYFDVFQGSPGPMSIAVRTQIMPAAVISQVRTEIRAVDPGLRLGGFTTLDDHVDESLGHEQLMATLSGFFASLALLLACVGLYGIMAYAVARRTNEIGVRMALGADRVQVLRMIVGESVLLIAAGVTLGLPVAFGATRLVSGQLYGLKPSDLGTMASAMLLLTVVGVLAGYIPARRATKIDPMVALRNE
ncbi:MAG TPA: ABC transporter permease [Terriglobia bacterium]